MSDPLAIAFICECTAVLILLSAAAAWLVNKFKRQPMDNPYNDGEP